MQHIATLDYIGLSILSILSSLSLSFFLSFFLSFIHSLDPSIWKCCLNESNECVLCPQLLHIVWIRLGCCMSCSKENGTRKCGKTWKGIWEFWLDKSRQLGKLIVAAVARRLLLPWPEHCAGVAWSFCWQDRTALGITCKAYFCRNMKNSWQSALKKYYGSYPMSTYQVTLCSVNHERRNHGNMSWKGCSNLKPLKPYGWDLDEALTLSQTFVFDWQELCSLAELLTCRASFLSHVGSNSWWPRQY